MEIKGNKKIMFILEQILIDRKKKKKKRSLTLTMKKANGV